MEEKDHKLKSTDSRVCVTIYMGRQICTFNYKSHPVLYMFMLPVYTNDGRLIVKIGYTSNIINRMLSLKTEFGCSKIYLMGVKLVRDKNDHQAFNKILAKKFKQQREDLVVRGIKKNGTYWLSESLMDEFDAINYVNDDRLAVNNCYDVMERIAQIELQSSNGNKRECILKKLEHIAKQREKMSRYVDTGRFVNIL